MFLIPSGCYRLPISVRRRMAERSVVRFSPHISHISRSAGSFPWGGISFVRRQHSIGSTASSRWRTRCFCSINPISFLLLWTVQPSGKLYIGTRIAVKPESGCLPVLLLPHIVVTRAGGFPEIDVLTAVLKAGGSQFCAAEVGGDLKQTARYFPALPGRVITTRPALRRSLS